MSTTPFKIKIKGSFKASKIFWLALNGFLVPGLNFDKMASLLKSTSTWINVAPPEHHNKRKEMEILYMPAGARKTWQYWPNKAVVELLMFDAFHFYAPVKNGPKIDLHSIDAFMYCIISAPEGWCARIISGWEIIYVPCLPSNVVAPKVITLEHINDYDAMLSLYKSNRHKDLFGPRKRTIYFLANDFARWAELPKIPIASKS